MIEIIKINSTLAVEIVSGADPHVAVDRAGGGLVRVEPSEVRHLVASLVTAAGLLAEQETARVEALTAAGRLGRQVMEARRLRRRRVGKE